MFQKFLPSSVAPIWSLTRFAITNSDYCIGKTTQFNIEDKKLNRTVFEFNNCLLLHYLYYLFCLIKIERKLASIISSFFKITNKIVKNIQKTITIIEYNNGFDVMIKNSINCSRIENSRKYS